MPEFSAGLNEDQLQIQKWAHDFAAEVIRPAAHEWDEREETPWPIIEEAAKIGLYSFDFFAQAVMGDTSGLTLPVTLEEIFWGDAGIGLAIFGSALAAAGIAEASQLSRQILLLLDGSFAVVLLHRDPSYMETAGQAAHALVEAALAGRAKPPSRRAR